MADKTSYQTRAQKSLLNYLQSSPGVHHTAAQIKAYFDNQDQPIGTATIYRHLEKFVEDGSVQKYTLGPGDSACYTFVGSQCRSTHFHCKCEVCGRLIHLDCDELNEIRSHLLEHHRFMWNPGKTVFYGICENCQKT